MSSQVKERMSRFELRGLRAPARPLGLSVKEFLAAISVAVFLILIVVYYFASLKPEQERLQSLEAELVSQQKILRDSLAPPGEGGATQEDTGRDALESLESFKGDYLKPLSKGRIALIEEINSLARKNNVALATGLDMRLEVRNDKDKEKGAKRKKEEQKLDVFPEMSVRFTVLGQYSNLRGFINDMDHNKHFMIIRSLNLTSVEQSTGGGGGRRGVSSSAGISLSIDLSAYFQP